MAKNPKIQYLISVAGHQYYSRKLADRFLCQTNGIITTPNGVRKANRDRAIADLLYFNPRAYVDATGLIDWKKIETLQRIFCKGCVCDE